MTDREKLDFFYRLGGIRETDGTFTLYWMSHMTFSEVMKLMPDEVIKK